MSDVEAAAVTLARTLTLGGTVWGVGAGAGFTAVDADDAEAELRSMARLGDSVVVMGDVVGRDRILRRCPAWGVQSVWIGEDARPEQGLAAVAILVPDAAAAQAAISAWALSLVGDTLALAPAVVECTDEVCITCSDEGRLGEVVAVQGEYLPALVRTADGEEEVDVTIVGEVAPRDLILIHAGSAIALVPDPIPARDSESRGAR